MELLTTLERVLATRLRPARRDLLVVAFSGGPDSTALLWGLTRVAPRWALRLHAAHLDHGLDPGSAARARSAAAAARALGVPVTAERRPVGSERRRGESPEQAARRVRYRFLERVRVDLGGRYVLTAHHRDDQIETLLLRLLQGSGLGGLAGISFRLGRVVRPLLDLPRVELDRALAAAGLEGLDDPTNDDLAAPRNRVRHLLLPALRAAEPGIDRHLPALARAAAGARDRLEAALESRLRPRATAEGVSVERRPLVELPGPLWRPALALLHRLAGIAYPPGRGVAADLRRQCREGRRVGCDCGGGWRWESHGTRLVLGRPEPPAPRFSYTLRVPGEVRIPELAVTLRLRRGAVESWMYRSSPGRAGLSLPLTPGEPVMIRNRRPGDRIRPLGCSYTRRLKDLLIDSGVPRRRRDRLPLLVVGDRVAWVPGVAVGHDFRLRGGDAAWIAQIDAVRQR